MAVMARRKKAWVLWKKPGRCGSSIVLNPPPATARRSIAKVFIPALPR